MACAAGRGMHREYVTSRIARCYEIVSRRGSAPEVGASPALASKTFAQKSKEKGGCDMTLKELRLQSKKTAAEVAAVLGVTHNAVSNYEGGTRSIGLEQILALAELYDVSEREVIEAQIESVKERKKE